MPIPFIPIIIGGGAALLGVGKSVKAAMDQSDAKDTNQRAQRIVDAAKEKAAASRDASNLAIENLGRKKLWVLNNSVESFISAFEQLHNVELGDSAGLDELRQFQIDKKGLSELREMSTMAISIAGGLVGGAATGTLTALGALGGVMTFGAASTGTAIASLSGIAATNATLAFLGGGSLAAGGLGIAGGTAVLGGLVAGPALAVLGFVVGAKASANKDSAYSNLAKAREFEEEIKNLRVLCRGIRMRANLFERLLIKLDALFQPLIESLNQVIEASGTDFRAFSAEEKGIVAANLSLAKAVKAVLDTPILTEEGTLTDESARIVDPVQRVINEYASA